MDRVFTAFEYPIDPQVGYFCVVDLKLLMLQSQRVIYVRGIHTVLISVRPLNSSAGRAVRGLFVRSLSGQRGNGKINDRYPGVGVSDVGLQWRERRAQSRIYYCRPYPLLRMQNVHLRAKIYY